MTGAAVNIAPAGGARSRRRLHAPRWTFALVSAGGVMLTLDVTVVNVALSAIARDLGAELHHVQWTVSAYSLAFGALLLSSGALSDRLGRRAVFVAGTALFTAASAGCAAAADAGTLVAARVAQGVGGAMMFGPALALLAAVYEGSRRRAAIAGFAAIASAAGAFGPLIGGLLVQAGSWRWIFWVNVPTGLLVAIGALSRMPEPAPLDPTRRIDALGALLAIGALLALHYPLIAGPEAGWLAPRVLASACAGVALLWALVVSQRRPHSMFDLTLLRIPALSGAAALGFLARMTSLGVLVFITLWLQSAYAASPLQVGVRLLPLTGSLVVVGLTTARLQARFCAGALVAGGFALHGAGLLGLALAGAHAPWPLAAAALALLGAGGAIIFPPLMGVAVASVPTERTGMASGLTNACYPLGTAAGVAVFGAVFSARISAGIALPALPAAAARSVRAAAETGQLDLIPAPLRALARASFADAFTAVCLSAAAACLLGIALALRFLPVAPRLEAPPSGSPPTTEETTCKLDNRK